MNLLKQIHLRLCKHEFETCKYWKFEGMFGEQIPYKIKCKKCGYEVKI